MRKYEEDLEDMLIRIIQEGKSDLLEEAKELMRATICPDCGGSGFVLEMQIYCVTPEMALDAEEPSMEGMEWEEQVEIICETCKGSGKVIKNERCGIDSM